MLPEVFRFNQTVGTKGIRYLNPSSVKYKKFRQAFFTCSCGSFFLAPIKYIKWDTVKGCKNCQRESHSDRGSKLYWVWANMKARCSNPNLPHYPNYGGRGITVCKRWANSFLSFKEDMAAGYKPGLQLDRADNNRGYSKDNCRWVTSKENCRNRRTNVKVKLRDREVTLIEFCETLGLNYKKVNGLHSRGKRGEELLT